MEPRNQLRLLNLEMEMQRAWLAAYLEDAESRAARRNRNVLWRLFMSIVSARRRPQDFARAAQPRTPPAGPRSRPTFG